MAWANLEPKRLGPAEAIRCRCGPFPKKLRSETFPFDIKLPSTPAAIYPQVENSMNKFHRVLGLSLVVLTAKAFADQKPRAHVGEEPAVENRGNAEALKVDNYEIHSAVWLERGCIALSHFSVAGHMVKGEESTAMQVQLWLNGYISGVNSMCFAVDPSPAITYPPKGWQDGRTIAPMILEFMKKNPSIPPTAKSLDVVTAWYLASHPKATDEHKGISKAIVEKISKKPDPTEVK